MSMSLLDVFAILLMTVGPLKATVVFASAMHDVDPAIRRGVARRTVLVAGGILLLFAFLGHPILQAFHVTLPALKLAGGLILLLFALELVASARVRNPAVGDDESPLTLAISPLAMPLVATPQGIVAVVAIAAAADGPVGVLEVALCIVVIMAIDFVCLLNAERILARIGQSGLMVIARIAGLLLAAMAMQLAISAGYDLGLVDRPGDGPG